MKDVVEAAVSAAAQRGLKATVIVLEGEGGDAGYVPPPPPGADAAAQDQLAQIAQQRDSALHQNEQLVTQIREAQAEIARLRAGGEAQAPAYEEPQGGTEVIDYDSMGIDTLNLPESVVKVCEKKEIATIGQLREQFQYLGKWRVNRKDCITAAEAIMGKIPTQHGGTPAAAPAPAGGNGADCPAGHTDRPWPDRLKAARGKEAKDGKLKTKLDDLYAQASTAIGGAMPEQGDRNFYVNALVALVGDDTAKLEGARSLGAYLDQRMVQEVTNAQIVALLYSLGFDPRAHTRIDAALKDAGLVQFMESVPE